MKKTHDLKPFFIIVGFFVLLLLFDKEKLLAENEKKADKESLKMVVMCALGKKVDNFPFYVYKEGQFYVNKDDQFKMNKFAATGYMGDFSSDCKIDSFCNEMPYVGQSCIKITYQAKPDQVYSWAGLFWQYPPNNWGNIPQAYDLSAAKRLTFWARGKEGTEVINKFQVGGIEGKYRDSGMASIGPIMLTQEWTKYTIDLTNLDNSIIVSQEDKECWPFMQPLSRIIGGFCWASSLAANNNNSITFYLDEIRFEND